MGSCLVLSLSSLPPSSASLRLVLLLVGSSLILLSVSLAAPFPPRPSSHTLCKGPTPHARLPACPGLSFLLGKPCSNPSGHLPGKQAAQCLSPRVDGGALGRGPFILALGSAPACETGPGHERTASCHPPGPVTGDDWQLLPASLHGLAQEGHPHHRCHLILLTVAWSSHLLHRGWPPT